MTPNTAVKLFENKKVRSAWDADAEKWYISIVDVVAVLTESPDPRNYANAQEYAAATANAHYIWYVFVGIGLISFIALMIYGKVLDKKDRRK